MSDKPGVLRRVADTAARPFNALDDEAKDVVSFTSVTAVVSGVLALFGVNGTALSTVAREAPVAIGAGIAIPLLACAAVFVFREGASWWTRLVPAAVAAGLVVLVFTITWTPTQPRAPALSVERVAGDDPALKVTASTANLQSKEQLSLLVWSPTIDEASRGETAADRVRAPSPSCTDAPDKDEPIGLAVLSQAQSGPDADGVATVTIEHPASLLEGAGAWRAVCATAVTPARCAWSVNWWGGDDVTSCALGVTAPSRQSTLQLRWP